MSQSSAARRSRPPRPLDLPPEEQEAGTELHGGEGWKEGRTSLPINAIASLSSSSGTPPRSIIRMWSSRFIASLMAAMRSLTSAGDPQIAGPESRVQLVSTVPTDAIDLSGTVSSGEFRVSAYVSDSQVRFEGSTTVVVRVILEKIPVKRD